MIFLGLHRFLLQWFVEKDDQPTYTRKQARTRSAAAAHADLAESPFHIGKRVVSPGAPLTPPNLGDAPPPPEPPDLEGLPATAGTVDRDADAELLYKRAKNLQQRRAYDLAVLWWKELSNRKEARRYQADAWYMRCLFELGDTATAQFLYNAPDASRDTLQVAGQLLVERGEYEAGLAIWKRLTGGLEEQRAEANFYRTVCMLQLGYLAEAEKLYTGQGQSVDALKAACDFFHAKGEYEKTLALWTRLKKLSQKYGGVARAGIVDCHLKLGQAAEAEKLYTDEKARVEVLRAAAMHFYRADDKTAAQPLFQRIAKITGDDDERITAEEYAARCTSNGP